MSAYRLSNRYAKNGTNEKIRWRVDIENQTNSEIAAEIRICESFSTAVRNLRLGQGYLADCDSIELRMLPSSILKNKQFAESNAWFYRGDTLQICIQGQGYYKHYFIEEPSD